MISMNNVILVKWPIVLSVNIQVLGTSLITMIYVVISRLNCNNFSDALQQS